MSQIPVTSGRDYKKWWILISALLIIAIISGGVVLGFKQWGRGEPVEIIIPNTPSSALDVYVSGAIANDGIYTCNEDSSLGCILQGAGGVNNDADLAGIEIYIPTMNESSLIQPQKININRAEAWLLEALYGVGETLAQRIIEYRENNGLFRNIDELTEVSGIGSKTLERIRDDITVVE